MAQIEVQTNVRLAIKHIDHLRLRRITLAEGEEPHDKSIKDCPATQYEHFKTILPIDNQNILVEQHSDKKLVITLVIVRNGIIAHHFW